MVSSTLFSSEGKPGTPHCLCSTPLQVLTKLKQVEEEKKVKQEKGNKQKLHHLFLALFLPGLPDLKNEK